MILPRGEWRPGELRGEMHFIIHKGLSVDLGGLAVEIRVVVDRVDLGEDCDILLDCCTPVELLVLREGHVLEFIFVTVLYEVVDRQFLIYVLFVEAICSGTIKITPLGIKGRAEGRRGGRRRDG